MGGRAGVGVSEREAPDCHIRRFYTSSFKEILRAAIGWLAVGECGCGWVWLWV